MNRQESYGLKADSADCTFWRRPDGLKEFGYQRAKVLEAVSRSLKHDDRNSELRYVLLKGQVAVNRDEDVELRLSSG
jgi:hypothetical protein